MFGPRTHINTLQDLSLVGYDPKLNYEQINVNNYMTYSIMDKGPEEVLMPSEEFTKEERAAMSRNRIQVRYEPREPIKKQNIDLNDYSLDFLPGQGPDLISAMAVDEDRRRTKEYQYFTNDSARQVPIGQVAPTKQNDIIYGSRLDALRLRQDFQNEFQTPDRGTPFIGVQKRGLDWNPHRTCNIEKKENEYMNEVTATTKTQYQEKVRQMQAVFGAMKDLEFDKDSMADILKRTVCNEKVGPSITGFEEADRDLGDSSEDIIKNSFTKLREIRKDKKRNGMSTDKEMIENMSDVVRASNIINEKAQSRSRRERFNTGIQDSFEDATVDPVKKLHIGKDSLNKFKRHVSDGPELEEENEQKLRRVRDNSIVLSRYFMLHESRDDIGPELEKEQKTGRRGIQEKNHGMGRKYFDGDSFFDDAGTDGTRKRPMMYFDTQAIKKVAGEKSFENEQGSGRIRGINASIQGASRNNGQVVHLMTKTDSTFSRMPGGSKKMIKKYNDPNQFESVMTK